MAVEMCDWCPEPATKRIDDVRGYEMAVSCDEHVKYAIRYVFPINDPRCGDRHDGDDEEGGVSEPAGDSPDSPAPGESRVPGGSDDYLPSENRPDDSAGIGTWNPLTKISEIPSKGILAYDMVLPEWPTREEYWTPFRNRLSRSKANEGSTS